MGFLGEANDLSLVSNYLRLTNYSADIFRAYIGLLSTLETFALQPTFAMPASIH